MAKVKCIFETYTERETEPDSGQYEQQMEEGCIAGNFNVCWENGILSVRRGNDFKTVSCTKEAYIRIKGIDGRLRTGTYRDIAYLEIDGTVFIGEKKKKNLKLHGYTAEDFRKAADFLADAEGYIDDNSPGHARDIDALFWATCAIANHLVTGEPLKTEDDDDMEG